MAKQTLKKPASANRVEIGKGIWSYARVRRNEKRERRTVQRIVQEAERAVQPLPVRIVPSAS